MHFSRQNLLPAMPSEARGISFDGEVPHVRIFSESDFEKLIRWSKTRDVDTRRRLDSLIEKITLAGSIRLLAKLPHRITKSLDEIETEFPNFSPVVVYLRQRFALEQLGERRLIFPPLLLAGPPGIGKTMFSTRLAELMCVPIFELSFATTQTSAALAGSDVHWSNSSEGAVFTWLVDSNVANFVAFIDEIDKAANFGEHVLQSPLHALYGLLEKRTAKRFLDAAQPHLPLDASHINWIFSANRIDSIDAPILQRMKIFHVELPTLAQSRSIVISIYRRLLETHAWGPAFEQELIPAVIDRLEYTPPRIAQMALLDGLGKAALRSDTRLMPDDIDVESRSKCRMGF